MSATIPPRVPLLARRALPRLFREPAVFVDVGESVSVGRALPWADAPRPPLLLQWGVRPSRGEGDIVWGHRPSSFYTVGATMLRE
jgi:hypothetical protein